MLGFVFREVWKEALDPRPVLPARALSESRWCGDDREIGAELAISTIR